MSRPRSAQPSRGGILYRVQGGNGGNTVFQAETEVDSRATDQVTLLRVRRLRVGNLAKFGAGCGWLAGAPFGVAASLASVWLARIVWSWLDALRPWSPWPSGQTLGGITLPTPELHPRELLQLERVYNLLSPAQHQPVPVFVAVAVSLAIVGGLLFAAAALGAGLIYNLFAAVTGGLEFEVTPVAARRAPDAAGRPVDGEVAVRPDPDQLEW